MSLKSWAQLYEVSELIHKPIREVMVQAIKDLWEFETSKRQYKQQQADEAKASAAERERKERDHYVVALAKHAEAKTYLKKRAAYMTAHEIYQAGRKIETAAKKVAKLAPKTV